jgi:Arc/MetJ-type ribon-helix-helix transcriptional regulator
MDIELTPDQKQFARLVIESGRLRDEDEVIGEALALWEERERTRIEVLSALERARASLERGEGRVIDQSSMEALARDVKQRGRARLTAERR